MMGQDQRSQVGKARGDFHHIHHDDHKHEGCNCRYLVGKLLSAVLFLKEQAQDQVRQGAKDQGKESGLNGVLNHHQLLFTGELLSITSTLSQVDLVNDGIAARDKEHTQHHSCGGMMIDEGLPVLLLNKVVNVVNAPLFHDDESV